MVRDNTGDISYSSIRYESLPSPSSMARHIFQYRPSFGISWWGQTHSTYQKSIVVPIDSSLPVSHHNSQRQIPTRPPGYQDNHKSKSCGVSALNCLFLLTNQRCEEDVGFFNSSVG